MKIEVIVPETVMPRPDPVNPCPCQFVPIKMNYKKGKLFWIAEQGEAVQEGQVICEGEVEKKVTEFKAPCSGTLTEICIPNGSQFREGDVIGYIEDGQI